MKGELPKRVFPLLSHYHNMRLIKQVWFILALFMPLRAMAIVAYPYPIKVKTEKGYTYITLQGDETLKYALTSDGYTVVQDTIGWKYLYKDADGQVKRSPFALEAPSQYSPALVTFLNSQEKGIRPVTVRNNALAIDRPQYSPQKQRQPVTGLRKALIVMMQFADCRFTKTQSDFNALFNQPNYSVDGASGSVFDYYKYTSYGQLELQCDVLGPFTAKYNMEYYGGNIGFEGHDKNPYALFTEALQAVSKQVDLKNYDANDDGLVDNFHIIYAGYGEEAGASSKAIWAHELTFSPMSVQGMMIDRYSCAPELRSSYGKGISRIGPHCHEIGHALGAMDYYDTDYETGGNYPGTGKWDVMASGSWNDQGVNPANFNPYTKAYDFGWVEVVTLNKDSLLQLQSSDISNKIYRINTPVANDYYLLENRKQTSFDCAVPGSGLLLFHVGPGIEGRTMANKINAGYPQECYVVCASSNFSLPSNEADTYGEVNSAGCPFPGKTDNYEFTPSSTPAALCQNGESADFSLTNIAVLNDGHISFDFTTGVTDSGAEDDVPRPVEGEMVWEEDFSEWTINDFWHQECHQGNMLWRKGLSFSGGTNSYAQLSSAASVWDADAYVTSTSLVSEVLDVNVDDYILSFDCSKYAKKRYTPDSIIVFVRKQGETVWVPVGQKRVDSEAWITHKFLIQKTCVPFELAFKGVVGKSSLIRLKHIALSRAISNSLRWAEKTEDKMCGYYSVTGTRAPSPHQGFNIIRLKDGTIKKIILKH